MSRLRTLSILSRVLALALLLALAGTSGATRFTTHLDDVEEYLIAEKAKADAGSSDTIVRSVVLDRLIKQIGKTTTSTRQELALLKKIGVKLLGKKAELGTGDPAAEAVLNRAQAGLTADMVFRLQSAKSTAEDLEGRGTGKFERKRKRVLVLIARGEDEIHAVDGQILTFKKLMNRRQKADTTASAAEKRVRKLLKGLADCPGRVFVGQESANVTHDGGLPVVFDTYKARPIAGTNDWQFDLFRCKPYAELRLILRIPSDGGEIRREIFSVPPGQDPGDSHSVLYREDPAANFRISFTGAATVSNWDPVAGSVTVGFFASNGLETLSGGSLTLTDWHE